MSKKYLLISLTLSLFTFALIACERSEKEYAAAPKRNGTSIPYTTTASVNTLESGDNVAGLVKVTAGAGAIDGKDLYAKNCSACHQVTGQGVPSAFPPLDGSEYVTGDVKNLSAIMIYGIQGPIKVKGADYNGVMPPPAGGQLKDEELAAIATYIRSTWSNKAAAVDTSVFAETRKKFGTRGMLTVAELGS